MKPNKALADLLPLFRKHYPVADVAATLRSAEEHARAQGHVEITTDDWDDATDDDDAPRMLGTGYITVYDNMTRRK